MTIKLPKNNVWRQNNYSDKFNDLWSSFNLDLTSQLGKVKVTPRILLNTSSTDQATMGVPTALAEFSITAKSAWAIVGTQVFSAADFKSAFIQDTLFNTAVYSAGQSDLATFNSCLYATSGTNRNIQKVNAAGSYSSLSNAMATAAGIHAMVLHRATTRLYFVDSNSTSIGSLDTSDTSASLGSQYTFQGVVDGVTEVITWIKSTSTRIFIGTFNVNSRLSKVYAWDGSQASGPNESYEIPAFGSLSCVIKDDVPVIIDTFGKLWQLNGGTFTELDKLPYVYGYPQGGDISNATTLAVHRNGMAVINNKVSIFVNTTLQNSASDTQENMPSGIWEYTKETGLYHKASPGLAKTGDSITDYGQAYISNIGPLMGTTISGASEESYILGCAYYPSSSTPVNGIFYSDYLDTKQKNGMLVTSKNYSTNITDTWQKIVCRLRKLITSTDRITVKYRTAETERRAVVGTWTSTTSFTTTTDIVTASAPYPSFAVGDEVTILSGTGSGKTAHITALQTGATAWIVTLDETFTGATGTSTVHLQKWKKIATLSDQGKDFWEVVIGQESPWVQFKICFLGQYKDEIGDIILVNKVNQPNS